MVEIPKRPEAPESNTHPNHSEAQQAQVLGESQPATSPCMKVADLPEAVFIQGTRSTHTSFDFTAERRADGTSFVRVWSTEAKVRSWINAFNPDAHRYCQLETIDFIFAVPQHPSVSIGYLLYDASPADVDSSGNALTLEGFPPGRIISLQALTFADLWPLFENRFRRDGVLDVTIDLVRQCAEARTDLAPLEAIAWAGGELCEFMGPIAEAEALDDDDMGPCGRCGQIHWHREVSGVDDHAQLGPWKCLYCDCDWPTAERLLRQGDAEPAEIAEQKQLHSAINANPDFWRATTRCPAPDACSRCGESAFTCESVSPTGNAVTYKCDYCKKAEIVRITTSSATRDENARRRIPKEVQREVWRRDGGRCVECGSKENLEFDHIIPLSKGGATTVRNMQLLCEECNRKKKNSDPGDY